MPGHQTISEVEVYGKPYGADLSIKACFGISVDQLPESWNYKRMIPLKKKGDVYKMRIPPLHYSPEGHKLSEFPPKGEYVYQGTLEEAIEKAKEDLSETVLRMVEKAVETALDYAYS